MAPCLICGLSIRNCARIHDLGNAGLVVGAEQRGAVGGDDVVADLVGKRGMIGGADDLRAGRPAARCRRRDNS